MGDPYAGLGVAIAPPPVVPATGAPSDDPYAAVGAEPVHPSELSFDQRNALLQEHIRKPGTSATDALNYAQQLGLRITSHMEENVGKPNARVRGETPPPPDTSGAHVAGVAGRGIATGLNDALGIGETIANPAGAILSHVAGMPSPSDWGKYLLDKIKGGRPETPGQNMLFSVTRGAASAGPFAAEAAPGAILATTLSGAAAGGAGEGARQAGYGPLVQGLAALGAGGVTGGGITALRPRAPGVVPPIVTPGQRVYQAADRLGMADKLLPADVGGTPTRMATSASAMTLGGIPIAEQATKGVNALAGARNATAEGAGRVADVTGAGQAIQTGARNFMGTSERRATQLYDEIPIHPTRPAVLSNTKQALSEVNAGLESNPELSALISDPRMKAFEDAIAGRSEQVPTGLLDASGKPLMRTIQRGGSLSWQDLKAFRTYVGEKAGQSSLQSDISQGALRRLYAGLSDDLGATAGAEGPKAVTAFNRATTYWRGRQDRIDNVLNTVLGNDLNKGSMSAFETVQRMGQTVGGDPVKLGRLMRSLSTDEADSARATIIHRMGQAKAGSQDAAGEVFSPAEFVTQWNKMDPRAKAILFNRSDLRQSLDDIAEVAAGMKLGTKYANTSKTALAMNGAALVWKVFSNPVLAAGAAGAELAIGRALASPMLARSIARVGRAKTPAAARNAVIGMGTIAARASDPGIRTAAAALQARFMNALNDNADLGRAAASDNPGQNQQQ